MSLSALTEHADTCIFAASQNLNAILLRVILQYFIPISISCKAEKMVKLFILTIFPPSVL